MGLLCLPRPFYVNIISPLPNCSASSINLLEVFLNVPLFQSYGLISFSHSSYGYFVLLRRNSPNHLTRLGRTFKKNSIRIVRAPFLLPKP